MRQIRSLGTIGLLIALLASPDVGGFLVAQTALPTPQQLDQLLAPVALYPDSLLAQITTASTNPQEILDVDNWLHQNQGLTGTALTDAAQQQGFDPAFIALVNFPQVLDMMAQNIDDYAAIGQAFQADQSSVTASIQRLRAQAYASGALRSNPQQQVVIQQAAGQPIYVIQPVSPSVVYVPQYDPTLVYVRPSTGGLIAASAISFGVGIAIGALLVPRPWGWGGWGWDWGGRYAYYNRGRWGGWGPNPYRPPRPWYRPRPVPWANRPGYGGRWNYRPNGYRPPYQRARGYRPAPGQPNGYRPPGNRGPNPPSKPSAPNRPGSKPPARPGEHNRPGYNPPAKPGERNRPGSNQPGTPGKTHNPNDNQRPRPERTNRPGSRQPSEAGKPNRPNTREPSRGGAENRPAGNRPANKRENKPAAKQPSKEHPSEKEGHERKNK